MPAEAFNVHGPFQRVPRDKPLFAHVARNSWNSFGDAPLVIHMRRSISLHHARA